MEEAVLLLRGGGYCLGRGWSRISSSLNLNASPINGGSGFEYRMAFQCGSSRSHNFIISLRENFGGVDIKSGASGRLRMSLSLRVIRYISLRGFKLLSAFLTSHIMTHRHIFHITTLTLHLLFQFCLILLEQPSH